MVEKESTIHTDSQNQSIPQPQLQHQSRQSKSRLMVETYMENKDHQHVQGSSEYTVEVSTSRDKKNVEDTRPKKKQLMEVDEKTMQKSQPSQKQGKQTKKWMPVINLKAGPSGVAHEKDVDGGQDIGPKVPLMEKCPQKELMEVDEKTMQKSQPSQKQGKQTKKWMPVINLKAGPSGVAHEKDVDGGQYIRPKVPLMEKCPQKVVLEEEQQFTTLEERQTNQPQAKKTQNLNPSIGRSDSTIISLNHFQTSNPIFEGNNLEVTTTIDSVNDPQE
ncbi:hypothetical protein ACH5RR_013219 [Cinchona calisaya]|uniref:Uncharacterized protein n=1 Tax=Cinchona calisaya TaxID=153742 RepID=A0ABD2ZZJ3_9GENT